MMSVGESGWLTGALIQRAYNTSKSRFKQVLDREIDNKQVRHILSCPIFLFQLFLAPSQAHVTSFNLCNCL